VNETKTCFFAYRNRKWHFFTRKIVVKVALFYTKNRSESSIFFCIVLFHLLGNDCQSIPIFFCYTKKECVQHVMKVSFFHLFA
jgi:hypothetical protein